MAQFAKHLTADEQPIQLALTGFVWQSFGGRCKFVSPLKGTMEPVRFQVTQLALMEFTTQANCQDTAKVILRLQKDPNKSADHLTLEYNTPLSYAWFAKRAQRAGLPPRRV